MIAKYIKRISPQPYLSTMFVIADMATYLFGILLKMMYLYTRKSCLNMMQSKATESGLTFAKLLPKIRTSKQLR